MYWIPICAFCEAKVYMCLRNKCFTMFLLSCRLINQKKSFKVLSVLCYICSMENVWNTELRERIKGLIEQKIGREVHVTTDFRNLSETILMETKKYISVITLRRLWGNLSDGRYNTMPRRFTLDILAQFVGYEDWDSFLLADNSDENVIYSYFVLDNELLAADLKKDSLLEILWAPDRVIRVRYMGNCMFRILESINSKLAAGDTFSVSSIIEGEPLLLGELFHNGCGPVKYICGKQGGVNCNILNNEE